MIVAAEIVPPVIVEFGDEDWYRTLVGNRRVEFTPKPVSPTAW